MKNRVSRVLSGMRPTGKLHLGHYVGALEKWVELQNDTLDEKKTHETFFLIADYHSLTTSLDTSNLEQNSFEMVMDWLISGIDPAKSPIFRQSKIKEHAELFLIFSMLITSSRLERNPSLKEQIQDLELDTVAYGHLGYPVLQAADILLYKGDTVPVGEDQLPHVEMTREIARRFNNIFGNVFPEPKGKSTKFARLIGLDGKAKMSKSLGNSILLSDSDADVTSKIRRAVTDPNKVRRNDPGNPEICPIYSYHKKFSGEHDLIDIQSGCRSGALGCVECKKKITKSIIAFLSPLFEKREHLSQNPSYIKDVLADGETKASTVAKNTMNEVREAMNLG